MNIGEEKKLCVEVEIVRELIYLGDWVSAGGGCEAAVTARTLCRWVKFRECSKLQYGRFPPKLNGTVYKSYVRPAVLHESEAWCLEESDI